MFVLALASPRPLTQFRWVKLIQGEETKQTKAGFAAGTVSEPAREEADEHYHSLEAAAGSYSEG